MAKMSLWDMPTSGPATEQELSIAQGGGGPMPSLDIPMREGYGEGRTGDQFQYLNDILMRGSYEGGGVGAMARAALARDPQQQMVSNYTPSPGLMQGTSISGFDPMAGKDPLGGPSLSGAPAAPPARAPRTKAAPSMGFSPRQEASMLQDLQGLPGIGQHLGSMGAEPIGAQLSTGGQEALDAGEQMVAADMEPNPTEAPSLFGTGIPPVQPMNYTNPMTGISFFEDDGPTPAPAMGTQDFAMPAGPPTAIQRSVPGLPPMSAETQFVGMPDPRMSMLPDPSEVLRIHSSSPAMQPSLYDDLRNNMQRKQSDVPGYSYPNVFDWK